MTEAVIENVSEVKAVGARGELRAHKTLEFTRHVIIHCTANLIALVCNGVLTFLLPRLLSMESYGYYRLFILYGSFAGVLHLGMLDGALIRWAARPRRRMKTELLGTFTFLLAGHAAILVPATAVLAALFHSRPWFFLVLALAAYAIVFNVSTLGQFALQAEKAFTLLSIVIILTPALLLLAVLTMHYLGNFTLGNLIVAFIFSWVVAGIPAWIFLYRKFGAAWRQWQDVWRIGIHNVRTGWSVLAALLLTNIALSLDRIAVSISYSIRDFAIYSLAATALAVVNTIIISISRVVFPYLSDGIDQNLRMDGYRSGEAILITLWAIGLVGYFPLHWLITRILPSYVASLPVLRLLMLGTGFTAIIHILQSNYLRSSLRLGRLLLGCCAAVVSALILLDLARRTGKLSMVPLAMLGALAIWWVLNESSLRLLTGGTYKSIGRTALVYGGCATWFAVCSSWRSLTAGACAYVPLVAIVIAVFYREILRSSSGLVGGRLKDWWIVGWSE